ncbi:MAG: HEAT repeat domain-containing protein [Nitrospirota bacterium]
MLLLKRWDNKTILILSISLVLSLFLLSIFLNTANSENSGLQLEEDINILTSTKATHKEKWEAKERIVKIGKDAVLPLINLLEDKSARYYAIRALGEIGDQRAIGRLSDLLRDRTYDRRRYAAIALGQIGGDPAIPPLKDALSDIDYVRKDAITALIKINSPKSIETLRRYLFEEGLSDGLEIEISSDKKRYKLDEKIRIIAKFINKRDSDIHIYQEKRLIPDSLVIRKKEGNFVMSEKTLEYERVMADHKKELYLLKKDASFQVEIEGAIRLWDKGRLLDHAYIPSDPFLTIDFNGIAYHIETSGQYEMTMVFQQAEEIKMSGERIGVENIWEGKVISNTITIEVL